MEQELEYKYYYKNELRLLTSLSLHEVAGFDCPPDHVLSLKKPDFYALYYVMIGKGIYTLDGTDFPVGENDIFALYPNTNIECRSDIDDPWTLRTVSFNGADALFLLNAARFDPKTPVRHLEMDLGVSVVRFMGNLYTQRGQDIFGTTQSTSILYAFMSLLIKTAAWDQKAMLPGWTGAIHVEKALSFIAENYAQQITVKDIAEHVNLSRSRLYRLFLQHVFISPQQYLIEYRIREGRILLEKRFGSVKEIAQAVGIEDPHYFSRMFKQVCGKSPTEFIKSFTEE
jgi:AraC-like DNA-binding protein